METRRSFITGAAAFLCAPAIVRVESLMPIHVPKQRTFYLSPGVYIKEYDISNFVPIRVGGGGRTLLHTTDYIIPRGNHDSFEMGSEILVPS